MASYVAPVTPPAQTWLRIEASLGAQPHDRRGAGGDDVAEPRVLARARHRLVGAGRRLRRRAGLCRHAADDRWRRAVPLLATLTGLKTKQPNFVATIGADGTSLTIVPAALLTADKRSMELWLIPKGGKPASLGLIAAGQPVRINMPPNCCSRSAPARRSRCRSNRSAARRPASPPARSSPTAISRGCNAVIAAAIAALIRERAMIAFMCVFVR